jgi:hypothetical protein
VPRIPTAVIAALALVVGFAVAQLSGVRAAGGIVLLAGAAWCVVREARRTAWWRLVVVGLVGVGGFVAAHPLADVIGPWPAVGLAALVLGTVTYALVPGTSSGRRTGPRSIPGRRGT